MRELRNKIEWQLYRIRSWYRRRRINKALATLRALGVRYHIPDNHACTNQIIIPRSNNIWHGIHKPF